MAVITQPILSSNTVVNVIVIDESLIPTWELPENQYFGPSGGSVGDVWNGTEYVKPSDPIPDPTINDVENERKRRIIVFLYAATGKTYNWNQAYEVINDGTREAASLLNIKVKHLISNTNPDWTQAQEQRAAELEVFNDNIDNITAKADIIKAMIPIPADYKDDLYWT